MKTLKRAAAVLMSFVMLFAVSGCMRTDAGRDVFTPDGKLKISFFSVGLDRLQAQTDETKRIMDYIEDKFKVSFSYISGSPMSWEQQLSQYIGGGDVPDIFFHDRKEPVYSTWLKEGYLFNYSEKLSSYPNLKKAFERYPDDMKFFLGGDYYSYPVVLDENSDSSVFNAHAMYYRRDWYDNLVSKNWKPSSGRSLVDPEDENFNYLNFYDLCEGFTKGDPDNNPSTATYGYGMHKDGGVYWWYPLLSMWGVDSEGWYQDDTGRWMPECISDDMKNAVMWMADMYDNGFINSDYSTKVTQEQMKANFINGQAGIMVYNAPPMGKGILDLIEGKSGDKPISDIVRGMPVPTGANNKKQMFGYPNYYGFIAVNNDVSDNKKQKILELMNWMLSEEGKVVLNEGLEGVHYKTENDKRVSLLGNDSKGFPLSLHDDQVAPGIVNIKSLTAWSSYIPETSDKYAEQMQLINAWDKKYLVIDELRYVSADPSYALRIASLKDSVSMAYKGIVTRVVGDKTQKRNDTWNSFVNNYLKTGDGYIDEINNQAKKLLGN